MPKMSQIISYLAHPPAHPTHPHKSPITALVRRLLPNATKFALKHFP